MEPDPATVCPVCQKEHTVTLAEAIQTQSATYRTLQRLIEGMTVKQLRHNPQPGKWSIRELISHLCDSEIAYAFRYRKILAEEKPVLVRYDQDLWATNLGYRHQDVKTTLEAFRALRLANLALLRGVPEDAWVRCGVHEQYGPLTLKELFLHLAANDRNHLDQIRRIRMQIRNTR